jgi:hypothetical protein
MRIWTKFTRSDFVKGIDPDLELGTLITIITLNFYLKVHSWANVYILYAFRTSGIPKANVEVIPVLWYGIRDSFFMIYWY